MREYTQFYINGQWVDPTTPKTLEVLDPSTEEACATISLGSAADVDLAVAAAKAAFETFSQTSVEERVAMLERMAEIFQRRIDEIAEAIRLEMGAPIKLASTAQAYAGLGHITEAAKILKGYTFSEDLGPHRVVKEPIGVCGLITPWNWPLNQVSCKVAPALAVGCTMVLKPSEIAPLSAYLYAEIMDEAGVPAGVFNLVNGDGPTVGAAISSHPEIDLVSFTGSTRAGREVAKAAADGIKRVTQELGGKSANIILEDAPDFAKAVAGGVAGCFGNSGQSCNAPTRMLVPQSKMDEAIEVARAAAAKATVGDPSAENTRLGPVVSEAQYKKIQGLIEKGIEEGADVIAGGAGKPEGLDKGYYVQPTVFANVSNDMTIAREEIFGPVLCIIPYQDDADAIRIANDTEYGLSGYVSGEPEHAQAVARQLRTGNVHLNGAGPDFSAPFGGYKQSGNGREWGIEGFEEFLEVKAIMGAA